MEYRTGIGFDVHALTEGRDLILGGVDIPFERGLDGHSDADVLVHALMDATDGSWQRWSDIGQHFPDTDDTYKGNIQHGAFARRFGICWQRTFFPLPTWI